MKYLETIKELLKLTNKLSKKYIVLLIVNSVLETLNIVLNIIIPKTIIDKLMMESSYSLLVKNIVLLFLLKYLLNLILKLSSLELNMESKILESKIIMEFSDKSLRLEYSNLENPEILDLKERALFAISNVGVLTSILATVNKIIMDLFILITTVAIIAYFNIYYLLFIFALMILSAYINKKNLDEVFVETQKVVPINRELGYYVNTALSDKNQKDYRLYDMSDMLIEKINVLNISAKDWLANIYKINGNNIIKQNIVLLALRFTAYSYTLIRSVSDILGSRIDLGQFVFYINTTEKAFQSFQSISVNYFEMIKDLNLLEPFKDFMLIEENIDLFGDLSVSNFESLEFDNVDFAYPGSDNLILNNVSFKIKKGDKISIVGINNAGKSTIVKLICGFFAPNKGSIKLNGIDIRDYDYEEYLDLISPVFQDFKLYPFDIEENISIDSIKSYDREEKVKEVLNKVGILGKITSLKDGVNSKLEKSIYKDAIDLSGGEKQKLAISRALYKSGQLVILDEPTSALDPIAESEIYEDFSKLIDDRTAIYISHRMSSSLLSDKILVLNNNKIEAFDTHKNLMKNNKLYSDLFISQMKNFN